MSTTLASRSAWKLAAIALGAFVFTFSLIPLYRIACEKVFGVRLEPGPVGAAAAAGLKEDTSRWVTVTFDAGVNSQLPWTFRAEQTSIRVHPGKLYEARFFARNDAGLPIVGNAVPSVAPSQASGYFSKTECFCFTAQTLAPGEARDMPVRFFVNPELPKDIDTITLSYTFYKNDALTARLGGAAPGVAAIVAPAP